MIQEKFTKLLLNLQIKKIGKDKKTIFKIILMFIKRGKKMGKFEILLDLFTFNVRFSYGHLYWDRCGQTILDIETQCDGWFNSRDPKHTGRLENPEKGMDVVFGNSHYTFSTRKFDILKEKLIIEEIQKIWKIIRANFGLEEYDRFGCRFHYLKPTESIDDSEILIKESDINVKIPDQLKDPNYNLKIRQITTIFEKDDVEYRVELKGVTRSQAVDPTSLYKDRPDTLSKYQKKYRLQKMKQLKEYSANPMYAVMLDVDCLNFNPEQLSIEKYIKKQIGLVKNDFLPILEKL